MVTLLGRGSPISTSLLTGDCTHTETALLKIQNDIAASMNSGKTDVLTLLDLSAPFDTIDHNIFLTASEIDFVLKALCWCGSNPILHNTNKKPN